MPLLKKLGIAVLTGIGLFGCESVNKPAFVAGPETQIETILEINQREDQYFFPAPGITQIVPVDEDGDNKIDYILYGTDDGRVYKEINKQ